MMLVCQSCLKWLLPGLIQGWNLISWKETQKIDFLGNEMKAGYHWTLYTFIELPIHLFLEFGNLIYSLEFYLMKKLNGLTWGLSSREIQIELDQLGILIFYIQKVLLDKNKNKKKFNPWISEIYEGSQNELQWKQVIQAEFHCSFDAIKDYPFETQVCNFVIDGDGDSPIKIGTLMIKNGSGAGKQSGKYTINSWKMLNFTTKGKKKCHRAFQPWILNIIYGNFSMNKIKRLIDAMA